MRQVFISYSRRDLNFVQRLASDLKEAGLDAWYDLSGLDGGARWRKEIEKAIRESQFVVVVLSPHSVESEWVEREYLFASNLRKKIIPLFYKSCDLPLYYLNMHYIDVRGKNYIRNMGEILRILGVNQEVRSEGLVPELEEPVFVKTEEEGIPKVEPKRAIIPRKLSTQSMVAFAGISIIIIAGIFSLPLIGRGFSPTSFPAELATATPSSTPTPTKTSTTIKTNIPVSTGTFTLSDSVSTPMTGNIPVTNNTPDPSCYRMNFISDVTIPDGTVVNPGQSFTKTWRVVNSGACAWKPGFTLRFIGGEKMHEEEATLDQNVEPGETFDFSVPMVAPTKLGRSISNWRLSTANGYFFGDQFFVDIIVK